MTERALLHLQVFLVIPLIGGFPALSQDRRPSIHPEFREGYRAFEDQEWESAADHM